MKYLIIIEQSEDGFGAYAPDFEGIITIRLLKSDIVLIENDSD